MSAAHDRATIRIAGAGTAPRLGYVDQRVDLVIDTTDLGGVVTHNSGDLTAVVGAGLPLASLQEQLSGYGQWLAIDPPTESLGATVGGLLTSGEAGPSRHRYGTMRDLVIGVTVILADGTAARSGGQVIKNVAGYDMVKLFCGSWGTLGLVTELSVRLHPRATSSATVRVLAGTGAATSLAMEVLAEPLVPRAVTWANDALHVRFEGTTSGVQAQVGAMRLLVRRASLRADVVIGEDEVLLWARVASVAAGIATGNRSAQNDKATSAAEPAGTGTVARASSLPHRFDDVAEAIRVAAESAGVKFALASHVGVGLHTVRIEEGAAAAHVATIDQWRSAVTAIGGRVVVFDRAPGVGDALDVLGPAPSSAALMKQVKNAFDPDGRLSPGRFGSWF